MASPKNAERLNEAMSQVEDGNAKHHELIAEWFYRGQSCMGWLSLLATNRQKNIKTYKFIDWEY